MDSRGGLALEHVVSWGRLFLGHIILGRMVLGHIVSEQVVLGEHAHPPKKLILLNHHL